MFRGCNRHFERRSGRLVDQPRFGCQRDPFCTLTLSAPTSGPKAGRMHDQRSTITPLSRLSHTKSSSLVFFKFLDVLHWITPPDVHLICFRLGTAPMPRRHPRRLVRQFKRLLPRPGKQTRVDSDSASCGVPQFFWPHFVVFSRTIAQAWKTLNDYLRCSCQRMRLR